MRALLALTLTLAMAQAATAQLTADKFRSKVEKKVAPPFGTIGSGKFKALCVCNSTDEIGAVESFNGIPELGATCTVPSFAPDGSFSFGYACYDWTPLTK